MIKFENLLTMLIMLFNRNVTSIEKAEARSQTWKPN